MLLPQKSKIIKIQKKEVFALTKFARLNWKIKIKKSTESITS